MKYFVGALLLLGVFVHFFWYIVSAVGVGVGVWCVVVVVREIGRQIKVRRARWAGLSARAVLQDRWYVEGDPRGTFGAPERHVIGRSEQE